MGSIETLKESLDSKSTLGKRGLKSKYLQKKEIESKEHFVAMLNQQQEEKQKMAEMTEEELQANQAEKAKLKAMFREDASDDSFCPIIIKSS